MDTAALVHHILDTHHAYLREHLPRLSAAFEAMGAGKQLTAPWRHLTRTLDSHMAKEEQILFPAILALAAGEPSSGCGVAGPIAQMEAEHDEIRTIEMALRAAAPLAGEHERGLLELLDDLSEHTRLEDEVLFPAALALEAGAPAEAEPEERWLRATRGICHDCLREVPARVVRDDSEVRLEKLCPDHGTSAQRLSTAPDYWEDLDRYYFQVNGESYPQRDYIVRMTERCNLSCPICLAKANTEDTPDLDLAGLERLLTERRGIKVDLMAAEPTLREDLEVWIRRVKEAGHIAALHTNGLKLADMDYARRIADAGVDEVFLQFDGFDDDANEALRGRRLLYARTKALENLRELNVGTSLIVVVARGLNEAEVGLTYEYALRPENQHIREVFFLGLRALGSARSAGQVAGHELGEMTMMPDELIDLLCAQRPEITREDIRRFNKLYFALLSAFRVKKCLYVQHYLVARDGRGGQTTAAELVDLAGIEAAAERYAEALPKGAIRAKARLLASVGRRSANPKTLAMAKDLLALQRLFREGMDLTALPQRFLLLGFITACDPWNFDASVAINCGKGELSADGGFTEQSAVANVQREVRFESAEVEGG